MLQWWTAGRSIRFFFFFLLDSQMHTQFFEHCFFSDSLLRIAFLFLSAFTFCKIGRKSRKITFPQWLCHQFNFWQLIKMYFIIYGFRIFMFSHRFIRIRNGINDKSNPMVKHRWPNWIVKFDMICDSDRTSLPNCYYTLQPVTDTLTHTLISENN